MSTYRLLKRLVPFVVVVIGPVTTSAQASSEERALSGISAVGIVVERLDPDAASCGIVEESLDAAARLPIANSRLKLDRRAQSYVYVRVTAMRIGSTCFATTEVSFRRPMWTKSEQGVAVWSRVWDLGYVIAGPAGDVGKKVNDKVEEFAKRFIAAWLQANE